MPDTAHGLAARLWTSTQVIDWLAAQGQPVKRRTWSGWVSRQRAPQPVTHILGRPLWDPDAVQAWHAARRGHGWRAGLTSTTTAPEGT